MGGTLGWAGTVPRPRGGCRSGGWAAARLCGSGCGCGCGESRNVVASVVLNAGSPPPPPGADDADTGVVWVRSPRLGSCGGNVAPASERGERRGDHARVPLRRFSKRVSGR